MKTFKLFLVILLFVLGGVTLAGCQSDDVPGEEEVPAATEETSAETEEETPVEEEEAPVEEEEAPVEEMSSTYHEAPMLHEMVTGGSLPSVDDRLPANPLVVTPVDSVGQYGGTWERAFLGVADFHALGRLFMRQFCVGRVILKTPFNQGWLKLGSGQMMAVRSLCISAKDLNGQMANPSR
jgi:hypothetical protein